MKTEAELRKYLEEVKQQITKEEKMKHKHLTIVGKTIMATIMYVLEDNTCIDLNRLHEDIKEQAK